MSPRKKKDENYTKLSAPEKRELNKKLNIASKRALSSIENELKYILLEAQRLEYNNAELYLVNRGQLNMIKKLEQDASRKMEEDDISKEFADFTDREFKIINRDMPSYKYSLYMRKTPFIITGKESGEENVLERLKKELDIHEKVKKKAMSEAIENDKEITAQRVDELKKATQKEIDADKAMIRKIIDNFDDYKVIITNYESAKYYPSIYYNDKKGKKHNAHLSIKIPNILWYEEDELRKGRKSDATIMEFISKAKKLGHFIYYEEK